MDPEPLVYLCAQFSFQRPHRHLRPQTAALAILQTTFRKHSTAPASQTTLRHDLGCYRSSYFFPSNSGSGNMPSASSRRRASSRAHVCILCMALARLAQQRLCFFPPLLSLVALPLPPHFPFSKDLCHLCQATPGRGTTYELSSLNTHPTAPNNKLPKNP